ncbi:PREDICTED: mitochondrial metalloendopeptidase OMA1-like [Fragaria vesca subsp. vesca]
MWLVIFLLVFLLFSADFLFVDGQDNAKLLKGLWNLSSVVFTLPFSRRMEMEADYIGLLLLASAGYDPMVAPGVYKKLSGTAGGSAKWEDYLSTHPSGEKRVENLSQAKVMEEALSIYRDVKQGRGVKGFL